MLKQFRYIAQQALKYFVSLFVITSHAFSHRKYRKLQCNFDECVVSVYMLKNFVQFFESVCTVAIACPIFFLIGKSIVSSKRRYRALLVDHVVRQVQPVASLIHRDTLGEHTAIS